MTHRVIRGVIMAEMLGAPPPGRPKRQRVGRGSKGAGIRFEQALAKVLKPQGWKHGKWFRFCDGYGHGCAQPDLIFVSPTAVYCIEAKLGNVAAGEAQFRELYKPVLEFVFQRPAFGIVAARHLASMPQPALRVVTALPEAIERSRTATCVLHWREGYPLGMAP